MARIVSRPTAGLQLFFGIVLLAVGCVTAFFALSGLARHQRAKSWPEVPARILTVGLWSGDEGERKVTCAYAYEFNGRPYVGRRVGVWDVPDNAGSWHEDTYYRLSSAHANRENVPCYVNPGRPEDSLLVRQIRYGVLALLMGFGTIFGSLGLQFLMAGVGGWRRARKARQLVLSYPDEPWLHEPDWTQGLLPPSPLARRSLTVWAMALYWNMISLPLLFVLPPEISGPYGFLAALDLAYPLIGLGMAIYALYLTRIQRKWGKSYFRLDTQPGVVGGHIRGKLAVVGEISAITRVELTLRCTRTTSGDENTISTTPWEETQVHEHAPALFGHGEMQVPVDFQIPGSCPATTENFITSVKWELIARAETPGVDLNLQFEVPVFVTADTDPGLGRSATILAAEEAAILTDEPPVPQIRIAEVAPGTRILTSSCWPGFGPFLVVAGLFLVMGGLTALLINASLKRDGSAIAMLPCCAPFALLLAVILPGLCVHPLRDRLTRRAASPAALGPHRLHAIGSGEPGVIYPVQAVIQLRREEVVCRSCPPVEWPQTHAGQHAAQRRRRPLVRAAGPDVPGPARDN